MSARHVHSWKHAPDWVSPLTISEGYTAIECFPCRAFRFVKNECLWKPCVATWEHSHGGFPGALEHPDYNPEVNEPPPIPFVGPNPQPDYNGAILTPHPDAGDVA